MYLTTHVPSTRFITSRTIRVSSSTAITRFACSSRRTVRFPVPGPISRTTSVRFTAARSTIPCHMRCTRFFFRVGGQDSREVSSTTIYVSSLLSERNLSQQTCRHTDLSAARVVSHVFCRVPSRSKNHDVRFTVVMANRTEKNKFHRESTTSVVMRLHGRDSKNTKIPYMQTRNYTGTQQSKCG